MSELNLMSQATPRRVPLAALPALMMIHGLCCAQPAPAAPAADEIANLPKTLGEWIDRGARKATKAELVAAFSNRQINAITPTGNQLDAFYKADGTYEGRMTVLRGRDAGASSRDVGTWVAHEDGRYCVSHNWLDWNRVFTNSCSHAFVQGEYVILTKSDTDRSGRVVVQKNKTSSP